LLRELFGGLRIGGCHSVIRIRGMRTSWRLDEESHGIPGV
jgi:hypothetical protein